MRPARVITVTPSSVLMTLEPLISRSLGLQTTLSGQPAVGYQSGDLGLVPQDVLISGPNLGCRLSRASALWSTSMEFGKA